MSKKKKMSIESAMVKAKHLDDETKQHLIDLVVTEKVLELGKAVVDLQKILGVKVSFKRAVVLNKEDPRTIFLELSSELNSITNNNGER